MHKDSSNTGRKRRKETQKAKRYQIIWSHGKGRKAERKRVVFSVETCRKTTVMSGRNRRQSKHRKQKRMILKYLDTWEMVKMQKEKV